MEQRSFEQPRSSPPKNWLVESILVTLFCCLPFGIAGIVFASQVSSKWAAGDYAGAERASLDAGKWTKVAFFVGLAQFVIGMIWFFIMGGSAFWRSRNGHF